jgi:hypothetical protein
LSIAQRDREALELAQRRSFGGAWLASLELELQARRLTLCVYGNLQGGGRDTYLAKLTFFGASAMRFENDAGAFPESVKLLSLELSFDDDEELGAAELRGARSWSLGWSFDGLSYEEHPAVMASLADDA